MDDTGPSGDNVQLPTNKTKPIKTKPNQRTHTPTDQQTNQHKKKLKETQEKHKKETTYLHASKITNRLRDLFLMAWPFHLAEPTTLPNK